MTIKDDISSDLKKAMLARDAIAKDALRMAKSEITLREVELGRDVDDAEVITILQKGVKSRGESIEQYDAAGRTESADKERKEIEVLSRYLPQQLSEQELSEAIAALVSELGLSGKKDMGRLMKELKARHGAAIDGRAASKLAGPALS